MPFLTCVGPSSLVVSSTTVHSLRFKRHLLRAPREYETEVGVPIVMTKLTIYYALLQGLSLKVPSSTSMISLVFCHMSIINSLRLLHRSNGPSEFDALFLVTPITFQDIIGASMSVCRRCPRMSDLQGTQRFRVDVSTHDGSSIFQMTQVSNISAAHVMSHMYYAAKARLAYIRGSTGLIDFSDNCRVSNR